VEASTPSREQAAVASAELQKARRMPAAIKAEDPELANLHGAAHTQKAAQIRHQKEAQETHALQDALTKASVADLGYDIFHKMTACTATFQWQQLGPILSEKGVCIVGWPMEVRFPPQTRGIAGLRAQERKSFGVAFEARKIPKQGVHSRRRTPMTVRLVMFFFLLFFFGPRH
jgi:hypothetical protein